MTEPTGRCGLEASRRVDDVPRDDALATLGSRAERDDRLAGRDGGTNGDLEPVGTKLLDRLQDPEPGPNGSLGVVLVRDRRAEDGHDRIADELLDRPAEALDVGLHALVVRAQRCANVLGIGAVGAIGEADEIDEEHRDDLALLADRSVAR